MTAETEVVTTKSGTIAKLALALSKAQGAMSGATKDSLNPAFKSKYADLASCWDAIRKPFADNELAVLQFVHQPDDKRVSIETQLHHSSGEFVSNTITIPIAQHSAHGVLTAITYARRGGLCAIAGIAPEDDDGNTASGVTPNQNGTPLHLRQPSRSSTPANTSAAPPARDASGSVQADYGTDGAPISERAKLEVAVAEAQDVPALEKLVERITKLPAADKASIRKAWGNRRDALKAETQPNPETMNEAERLAAEPSESAAGA